MPRGYKPCPNCSALSGLRTFFCKECGYNFFPNKEKKEPKIKNEGIGPGKKKCPNCEFVCGAKSYNCPSCDYDFKPGVERKKYVPVNKRLKKNEIVVEDWRLIEVGSKIRLLKNSGSYYLTEEGEKVFMQDSGIYLVKGLDMQGIRVYGSNGFGFLYMGESKVGVLDSIFKEPCNIALIKEKL